MCPGDPETEYWSVPGDPSRAPDKDALSITICSYRLTHFNSKKGVMFTFFNYLLRIWMYFPA